MPEMPKWLIVLVAVIAFTWILMQVTSFVGKVGTTVDKANTSINNSQTTVNTVENYYD